MYQHHCIIIIMITIIIVFLFSTTSSQREPSTHEASPGRGALAYIHTYIHRYVHVQIHLYVCTYVYTYIYTPTVCHHVIYMHSTYVHTYVGMYVISPPIILSFQAEEEMRKKVDLIKQIRAIESVPIIRHKFVDLTETSGHGLLSEMSIAEVSSSQHEHSRCSTC